MVTTTYGSMCAKAITKFQERNGLKQTGECDKATYDKLMADGATAYTMKEKDKLDIVRTIQEVLIKKGYLKGKATGYCGTDTVVAVKAFQKANNLTVDGQAGTKTLELLLSTEIFETRKAAERSAAYLWGILNQKGRRDLYRACRLSRARL